MNSPVSITITMVGPSGVGKTSLLAAMYKELQPELNKIGCTFTTDGPTTTSIGKRLRELEAAANSSSIKVQENEGIDGTTLKQEFVFKLDVGDGGEPEAVLRFVDLPGSWYTGQGDHEQADNILCNSHVSVLAVDATALMEKPPDADGGLGKHHKLINDPFSINGAYQRVLPKITREHIVVICLIRAETYVLSGRTEELYRCVKSAYREFADSLKMERFGRPHQTHVYATHVETVGNMVLHRMAEKDGHIRTEFIKKPGIGYSPKHCARPLRIALREALRVVQEKEKEKEKKEDHLGNRLLDFFGIPTPLRESWDKLDLINKKLEKLSKKISDKDYIRIDE